MSHPVYCFDDCTIDTALRELRRHGDLIALSPKVFDCLAYLVEHRDRAIGRDELIAAVWGRVDVSDTLLGQTILKARRAVGDAGHSQAAIRTIPRFGYRWAAETVRGVPVSDSSGDAHEPLGETQLAQGDNALATPAAVLDDAQTAPLARAPQLHPSISSEPRTRRHGPAWIAAALAVVVAAGWIAVEHGRHPGDAPSVVANTPPVKTTSTSVAVMPATTAAGDEWSWLRLGLMDFVAHRLRRAGQPVVPSDNVVALMRTSANGTALSDRAVQKATGARYLLIPQAQRTPQGWRVRLALHAATGTPHVFEAQGADAIATAASATDRLLVALGKSSPAQPANAAALSLAQLQQRSEAAMLNSDFATARTLIEAAPPALRDAPELRLRLAQIAFRSGQLDAASTQLRALLAQTPASADPILRARALYTTGGVALREDRSEDAERAFAEAVTLATRQDNPGVRGQAFLGLAAARVNLGRYDEAGDDLARARIALGMADDTLALARVDANEGVLDNARGRPAEALPVLRRAAERFRSFGTLNEWFLTIAAEIKAHLALLDPNAALAASDQVWAQVDTLDNPGTRHALGVQRARALAAVGRSAEAAHLLATLAAAFAGDEQSGLPGDVASSRARGFLAAGDAQRAAELAREAIARLPTIDEVHERARAWLTLTRALRGSSDEAGAAAQTRGFSDWAARANGRGATLFAALARAEQARAEHAAAAAESDFSNALTEAEKRGVPADLAAVAMSYGDALLADGEIERASAVIGRVARWADRDFDCAVLQFRLYRALGESAASATALARARSLAGERPLPPLHQSPAASMVHARPGG